MRSLMGVGQASEPWEDKIMAVAAKAWPTVRAPETFLEQVENYGSGFSLSKAR